MPESRMETFRVIESEPEASLHPRAIWEHWKKHVIWDPRTYYGVLSLLAVVTPVIADDRVCSCVGILFCPHHYLLIRT